jgi:hypothetical protein
MSRPCARERLAILADHVGDVDEASHAATLLVAVAHDTRDRVVWGGDRAITYWQRLPERVRAACYGGPSLADWWERISRLLGCIPPTRVEDREDVARIVHLDDPQVMRTLRTQAEMVCLRVRLAMQLTADSKKWEGS